MIPRKFAQLRLVVLTISMLLIQFVAKAQIEVSVPFNDGFIGLVGNNTNQATNIQRFGALEIAKVQFVQTTNSGRFVLTQGNDIKGTLRLQLTNGRKVDIAGSLNWRVNSGGTNQLFGFIADANISLNLSAYGGVNYSISGGNTTGKSNFGFKLNNVAYTFPNNGQTVSGNAATGNTALDDLNAYLDAQPRVVAPAPANFLLNTPNQDPGDFVVANFAANDILFASVGLVNPPAGASFSFGTTTGLTRSTGYSSWTGITRISFTGTQANINAALASLSISTGTTAGDIKLSVSAAANDPGVFYNPVNGHYYKPVSGAITYTNAKTAAALQTYKGRPGYLVTITSASEQDFVNNNTSQSNIWIALSDANSEGTWYIDAGPEEGTVIWRTSTSNITNATTSSYSSAGASVSGNYINWCGSEPNNADGGNAGEDYAVTKWNSGTCWNDLAGANSSSIGGYLVEYGTWNDPDENAFLDFYSASTTYVANCPSNQAPVAPTVVSQGTNAGAGSVRLEVSVASGMTADWYASSTGGSVLSGGQGVTIFNTPVITGTTTFYAQTRNTTTGCLSASRTAVTATIVACPITMPNIQFKLSPPDVTTSAIQGQNGVLTENFNSLATSVNMNSGTFANGPYNRTAGVLRVLPTDVWGGTGTNYLAITSSGLVSITLSQPSRYVGFWWGAGDQANQVTIYGTCGGNEIQLGQFATSTVLTLLNSATVLAVDGNTYNSSLYRRANAANEPFAYINLQLDDPNIFITRLEFGGGGFELDNITTSTSYGAATFSTPSAPTITSITPASGSATVNFTAPTSNGGQPITNYEYSTDGGTTWVAVSPAATTSPITITGLTNGTSYSVRVRAVNSIGSGSQSNAINVTPNTTPPVITSFSPSIAGTGETVVITGTGFTGVSIVRFGNVNAASFVVNSSTQITAVVAAGGSGDVLVQNSAGSDTEPGFLYKVVELKFDGNTLDNTDANRDATIVGTATYGTGASGQAICFTNNNVVNGTTVQNYLTLPSDLIRGRGSNFTVSLRFKTNSFGGILGYQNAAVGSGSRTQWVPILYVQSDGKLNANLWQGSVLNVTSTNRVDDGNWHKVEFSAAPGSITVYIDGVLAGTSTGTIDHLSMSFNQLGAVTTEGVWTGDPIDGWFGFNGCIDEFVIIDRSLTASQIQQVTQLPLPTISSFSPTTAKSGETITITGTNLGSASSVRIGGVEARSISVVSATEIRVIVPRNPTLNNSILVTTAAGTTSATSFTFDCTNLALDFDATNDHVVIGDKIENLGAFSQEAWVYWKGSSHPDYYNEIFTKDYISALAITNANELHANFGDGTSWGSGLNSRTLIPLNTWTHVAVTRSANGLVKMYINGVLDVNTATLNKSGANAAIRAIGAKPFGNTRYGHFNGAIDELKVWNTERTAQQIQVDLSDEAVGDGAGLIAYYNFNQGIAAGNNTAVTTLNNLTPNVSLSATITNMALTGATSNFVQGVWPVVTVQPIATSNVCLGNVVSLSITAAGPQLTYQWYTNTTASNTGGTAISGANAATYTFTSSSVGTQYFYVVINGVCSRSTTSSVSTVNTTAVPQISYVSNYGFERTNAINNIAPTSSGAVVTSYSISPALPQGLSFNTTTGVISGTPLVNSTARSYTVTGNAASGCTGTATFNLEVFSAVAPSALFYTPPSQTVRQGTAITAMVPSASGGAIASYAISPSLPAGLNFNTTTGVVSGTLTAPQTGTVTYTITATNSGGTATDGVILIFNTAPTDLSVSSASVAENEASGTAVGTLSATDADAGDTFTYSLVSGTGSTDNASFTIDGSTLKTAAVFDFETKTSYSVRVRVTDAGGLSFEKALTISVTNVNEAPTNISASASSVAENEASGTSVATMSAIDVDAGDTFTYSLVAGTGDADNASFTIDGATLKTAGVFDFETKSSYSVRVRVTDAAGLTYEKVFTISVTDVNDAPRNISLSVSTVAENEASGTSVATMSATDVDAGDTFTYSLVAGTGDADNASFTIDGATLKTAGVFDFETKSSYSVRVRVTDAAGLSFEKEFTITVTDVNEAPTALALTGTSVLENAASGTAVGTLAGTDADAGDTHTYTLVSGTGSTDNASFTITGTTISTAAVFNFEAKNSYSVRVRVTDAGGLSFEKAFTITVTDVNEAPTLTAITDRRVYNVSTSQIVNLAGITAGPETAQTTTTSVSTSNPTVFTAINVVGTQIQFTLAAGIATPQDVVVTVRVKDNGGIANGGVDSVVRTFKLGIDPMPVAAASPNLITLGATAQLSATGANAVNYTWVAVGGTGIVGSGATINVRPRGTTTYAVVVTNSFGYQATVPVLLTVIVDYKLVPNNLVTPNGDGVNDKWVIPNIDMYPDNEVMVYDKAGRAVFAKRGYNNEWDGTINGKKLKEDAYFYVIKFNKDGALPIRGYVSIVR